MTRATKPILALAGLSMITLTACTDPAQLGGNSVPAGQNTQQGAILGGILGAAVGGITNDNTRQGVVRGAIIGAGVGAGTGYLLDRQEAQLRNDLANQNITVNNTGDRLIVTMPQDVLFAVDSYNVNPGLRTDLMTVANSLQQYPNSTVQIIGHTDSDGDAAYNQQLSERRANAVADVLMQGGVPFGRIQTFGRGENAPIATNLTEEGKAQNRRVEIVILPTAQS